MKDNIFKTQKDKEFIERLFPRAGEPLHSDLYSQIYDYLVDNHKELNLEERGAYLPVLLDFRKSQLRTKYEEIKINFLKSPALQKLERQLKNNEIIQFFIPKYDPYIRIKNKQLYIDLPKGNTAIIDLTKNDMKLMYYGQPIEDYSERTFNTLNKVLNDLDYLVVENKKILEDETQAIKAERTFEDGSPRGLYKFFKKENIDQMTLISDVSSRGHWLWGNNFYLFVYKKKLFHFEAYNSEINISISDRTPKLRGTLRLFNEVENTGEGGYELPITKDLRKVFGRSSIFQEIDLDNFI